jgi:hypothetical protein
LDLLWNISTTKYTLPFNCGMVRVLLYLWKESSMTDEAVFAFLETIKCDWKHITTLNSSKSTYANNKFSLKLLWNNLLSKYFYKF